MTVLKVSVVRHETRIGWFLMTMTSVGDDIGQTTMQMLLREEHLRAIREGADRALSGKPPLDFEIFRKIGD
jgi:hypothetical protein